MRDKLLEKLTKTLVLDRGWTRPTSTTHLNDRPGEIIAKSPMYVENQWGEKTDPTAEIFQPSFVQWVLSVSFQWIHGTAELF